VLDIRKFSSIIYIWYEDGHHRPFLVRFQELNLALPHRAGGAPKRRAAVG
jgi:hypothetical protein